jgi:hypothetical protein
MVLLGLVVVMASEALNQSTQPSSLAMTTIKPINTIFTSHDND